MLGSWEKQEVEEIEKQLETQMAEPAGPPADKGGSETPLAVEPPASAACSDVPRVLAVPATAPPASAAGSGGATPAPLPSEMPPPQSVPAKFECITSTTHKSQWMKLERVCSGPRAAQFPEIARAFGSGTKAERTQVLRNFVQNGENLDALEGSFKATCTHSERVKTTRRLMTISQMQAEGFSECPCCN